MLRDFKNIPYLATLTNTRHTAYTYFHKQEYSKFMLILEFSHVALETINWNCNFIWPLLKSFVCSSMGSSDSWSWCNILCQSAYSKPTTYLVIHWHHLSGHFKNKYSDWRLFITFVIALFWSLHHRAQF